LIPATPLDPGDIGLVRAYLKIVKPEQTDDHDRLIPFRFNPSEYQVKKTQTIAEIGIPGLASPIIQWVRGGSESLTFEALFDTSNTLEDVNDAFVGRLRALLDPDRRKHAPPIVAFIWGPRHFEGLLDGLSTSYTLFSKDGTPLRAKASITLKEYRSAEVQVVQHERSSLDVAKFYMVQLGDTWSNLAASLLQDPARWRELAYANGIVDTRELRPGLRLVVPRLR
jgi:nucleoid-associated protein YgaU